MSLSRKIATLIIEEKVTLNQVIDSLLKYKMMSLLPSVRQAVMQLASQKDSTDTIMIESPFALSTDAIKKVKRIVGNDIADHEVVINKNVLSGFKARFRGKLYDGSAERIIKELTGK